MKKKSPIDLWKKKHIGIVNKVSNNYISREDSNFTSARSPVVIEVFKFLLRPTTEGYITCDGAGNIEIKLKMTESSLYGSTITLKLDETLKLSDVNIYEIKIIHTGTDSSYRLNVS